MKDEMFNFYKNALLGSATGTPICEQYKHEWQTCGKDKDKLLRFALRQACIPFLFTYSFNGMGLSKEYLLKEYKDYINGAYCVKDADMVQGYTYMLNVDYKGQYTQNIDVSAFMYTMEASVIVPLTKCPSYFVGCSSDIHFGLEGYNSVRIYLYDNSKVTVDYCDEESDVTIFKYSEDAEVEIGKYCLGKVREFNKDLRLQL